MNSIKKELSDQPDTKKGINRRKMLKALAGVPVIGLFGFGVLKKIQYDKTHNIRKEVLNELGINDILSQVKSVPEGAKGDLIRIGMVGHGHRGEFLVNAIGYMNAEQFNRRGTAGKLAAQIRFGNLNVALTGICDVFDNHAEKGMLAAQHDIHTQGELAKKHPVKRYLHYHDMLADKNIDAVIIATPDHHHAQMTIDAIKAGKHVYCEKSLIRREEEIHKVYDVVKNSNFVFQQGHQVPQNAIFQQAKEIIERGLLGNISHIETSTNRNSSKGAWINHLDNANNPKPGSEQSIDWKQWLGTTPYKPFSIERYYGWSRFSDYGTGLIGQLFSHEFDAANSLLNIGIPSSVVSSGGQYFYKEYGDVPDVLNCVFEYPNRNLALTYSANLASSKSRPRTFYGQDASMTLGSDITITPDANSSQYSSLIKRGLINPNSPMLSVVKDGQQTGGVDGVTSATSKYYATRGLVSTNIGGLEYDVTHLHMREWINCIRNGGETSANIEKAYAEGVAIAMADISYREKCRVEWDSINKKIKRC